MKLKKKLTSSLKSIDLHGLRYKNAEINLEDFILEEQPPFEVIIGNSEGMSKIVKKLLEKYNLSAFHLNPNNTGSVMVVEMLQ